MNTSCTPAISIAEAYHLRSYGIYKGEVAGIDFYVSSSTPTSPFHAGISGQLYFSGSGHMSTNSWKSGYPPATGQPFTTPINYVAGNANSGHGDIATNGNLSLSGNSKINGAASYGTGSPPPAGTVTGAVTQGLTPPVTVSVPPPSGPMLDTMMNPGGNQGGDNQVGLSGSQVFNIGGPANNVTGYPSGPLTGNFQISGLNLSGNSAVNVYPASGGTVNFFINEDLQVSGNAKFNIVQPAGVPPGTVNIFLSTTFKPSVWVGSWQDGPQTEISGNGFTNTSSAPATLNIISDNAEYINISGNGNFTGTILAPNTPVTLSGNAGIAGSLVAQSIDISGNAQILFDQSLTQASSAGTPPPYRVFATVDVAGKGQ